jgi:uncharacterized protein YqgQ
MKKSANTINTHPMLAKTTSIVRIIKNSPENLLMIGIGLFASVFALKESVKFFKKSDEQKANDQIEHDIDNTSLSYPISYYAQMADVIQEATDNSGTDTDAINRVFEKMNNNYDVLQLIKAYGSRWNFFFGVPLGSFTLPQILVSELSNSEIGDLNNLLTNKGITIQF